MDIDPKDKAMIDAYVDLTEEERSRRGWRFWLVIAAASVGALWMVRYDFIPDILRLILAIIGGLGLLLFLVFLSTRPFGRDFYAGPSWWI